MSTITPNIQMTDAGLVRVTWAGLAAGDDGAPIDYPAYADRTVQVSGVLDGASVVLEGSLLDPPTAWATLTDQLGSEVSMSGADIKLVAETTAFTRPRIVSGAGSVNVNVTMILRRK